MIILYHEKREFAIEKNIWRKTFALLYFPPLPYCSGAALTS